jgi:hypothetical protein
MYAELNTHISWVPTISFEVRVRVVNNLFLLDFIEIGLHVV